MLIGPFGEQTPQGNPRVEEEETVSNNFLRMNHFPSSAVPLPFSVPGPFSEGHVMKLHQSQIPRRTSTTHNLHRIPLLTRP